MLNELAKKILGHFGGKKQTLAKQDAARLRAERTAPPKYDLSSPSGLIGSLDAASGEAVRGILLATRARAVPFNNVRRLPDGSLVPYRGSLSDRDDSVILSNVNVDGNPAFCQIVYAKKKIQNLGLAAEVEHAAGRFIERFVSEGMDGRPNKENL